MTDRPLNFKLYGEYVNTYGILKRELYLPHDASDLKISRIAEKLVGVDIRRVEVTGNWLQWNGWCWQKRDNVTPILDNLADVVERHISDTRRQRSQNPLTFNKELAEWCHVPEDDKKRLDEKFEYYIDIEKAIYKKLTAGSSRNTIIQIMGSHLSVDPEKLDQNTDKIVFMNGYHDCQTGKFLENDRSQHATLGIRTNFVEPDQESKDNIRNYLNGLGFDAETLDYIQRSFGYAATGRGSEKRFWWFRGETDTSKSTLINIVAKCLDQYALTTPSDQWCDKKIQGGGHTEELARLRARRLITSDEFKKNSKFNEPLIKRLTAGSGEMSASRKSEQTIDFNITFALFFASNFDCQMAEDDTAFLNRLNTITFEKAIAPEIKDTQFIPKFLSKGQNKMAMLQWIMEGAHKYCVEGIGTDPEHIKTSREEFLEQQISITEQLGEILEKNDKAVGKKAVTLNAVLEALSQMQKATRQYSSFSKKEVSKAIETVFGVKRTSSNGHSGYSGLMLKNDFTPKKRRPYDPRIDHGYEDQDQFDDYEAPVEKSN